MGLFGKLFGGDKEETEEYTRKSDENKSKSPEVLRTSRSGGYNKMNVLTVIDAYNSELAALTEAAEAKKKGKPYTLPASAAPDELVKVTSGGFDESDVEQYIKTLKDMINELRSQL